MTPVPQGVISTSTGPVDPTPAAVEEVVEEVVEAVEDTQPATEEDNALAEATIKAMGIDQA